MATARDIALCTCRKGDNNPDRCRARIAKVDDIETALRAEIAKDIRAEKDNPSRGWNDYSPTGVSDSTNKIFIGMREGLETAARITERKSV